MSLVSGIEHHFVEKLEKTAVERLSTVGHVEAPGIGMVIYHRKTNSLEVVEDKKILEEIRENWDCNHSS